MQKRREKTDPRLTERYSLYPFILFLYRHIQDSIYTIIPHMYQVYLQKKPFYMFLYPQDRIPYLSRSHLSSCVSHTASRRFETSFDFIYVILLPSCPRSRVAGTRKSGVDGYPSIPPGFLYKALEISSFYVPRRPVSWQQFQEVVASIQNWSCALAIQTEVLPFVSDGFFSGQSCVLPRALSGASR